MPQASRRRWGQFRWRRVYSQVLTLAAEFAPPAHAAVDLPARASCAGRADTPQSELRAGGAERSDRAFAAARVPATRQGFRYVALATVLLVVVSGFAVSVADAEKFPNVWRGMWWAITTVTTVGYGT